MDDFEIKLLKFNIIGVPIIFLWIHIVLYLTN